jgi:hypothetical protein
MGVFLKEDCFQISQYCAALGDFDHVNVGSQTATTIAVCKDARYVGDGLSMVIWWLKNVQGNPTTISFVPTSGGQYWYGGSATSVFTGIPSTATLDTFNCAGYNSTGPNVACCLNGYLQSFPITPASSGEFLWGAGVQYGNAPSGFGPGWSGSNLDTAYFGKADEYIQQYNSTAPIVAPFAAGTGPVSWAATVAIKP